MRNLEEGSARKDNSAEVLLDQPLDGARLDRANQKEIHIRGQANGGGKVAQLRRQLGRRYLTPRDLLFHRVLSVRVEFAEQLAIELAQRQFVGAVLVEIKLLE